MELVLGGAVSLIIQFLKKKLNLGEYGTLAVLFALAVISAALFQLFVHVGIWETVAQTLLYAGSFYTFIIQRFEEGSTLSKAIQNG